MNERRFFNGSLTVKVPLQLLVAASTELPPDHLMPLLDRFLLRVRIERLKAPKDWAMLLDGNEPDIRSALTLTSLRSR